MNKLTLSEPIASLECIVKRSVLAVATAVALSSAVLIPVNVAAYNNTCREIDSQVENDPLVSAHKLSGSVVCEKLAKEYLQKLDNQGFSLLTIGNRYAAQQYFGECYRFNHSLINGRVGVI